MARSLRPTPTARPARARAPRPLPHTRKGDGPRRQYPRRHVGCHGTASPRRDAETEGRAANARMPDTKIRPPAMMNIRLTELRVMPANEARKLRRTVLVSQLEP